MLGIGKKVKLRENVMEDGGIDYMHLGIYGEIIICEEILKKKDKFSTIYNHKSWLWSVF